MKPWILTTLSIFLLPLHIQAAKSKFVMGSFFKNEAPWLKEWIEYYKVLGAEHFYLYDNGSTDHPEEVLAPYIKEGIVDLIRWENTPINLIYPVQKEKSFPSYEYAAFYNYIRRIKYKTMSAGFFHIDQFLVPTGGPQQDFLPHLLKDFPDVASFQFENFFFGTSFESEIPEDSLMIETLILKGPKAQVEPLKYIGIHFPFYLRMTEKDVLIGGKKSQIQIDKEEIRVNCYLTKDQKSLYEKKDPSSWEELERELNQIYDGTILQFLPPLRHAMNY